MVIGMNKLLLSVVMFFLGSSSLLHLVLFFKSEELSHLVQTLVYFSPMFYLALRRYNLSKKLFIFGAYGLFCIDSISSSEVILLSYDFFVIVFKLAALGFVSYRVFLWLARKYEQYRLMPRTSVFGTRKKRHSRVENDYDPDLRNDPAYSDLSGNIYND